MGPPDFALREISAAGGPALQVVETSRAAAFGDVDNDGDIDVLISTSGGSPRLLRNDVGHESPWLALRLVGTRGNQSSIGAVVRLVRRDRPDLVRRVHADASYCSANDLRVFFGLGADEGPQAVVVEWPGGSAPEIFPGLPARALSVLREGEGAVP
jgi:hypothetical protein